MLLVIDIGNTNITLGFYCDNELKFTSRMYSSREKSEDEFAAQMMNTFSLYDIKTTEIEDVIISSVVPEITNNICSAVRHITKKTPFLVGKEINGKLNCEVIPLEYLGADIICGCVGAISKYKLPALVVDMGTATKILAIDKNGYFLGCIIAPGIKISLEALTKKASLLPSITFTKPEHVTGTNTIECMQSGLVYGNACMIDGLIEKMTEELDFEKPTLIATGGYIKGISKCCKTKLIYDENLLLDGLNEIYKKI